MLSDTGVVALRDDTSSSRMRLRVDPTEFARLLKVVSDENKLLQEMLNEIEPTRVLALSYDELFQSEESRAQVMDRCFKFLGVTPIETQTRMKKIIKGPITEVIENFDDCLANIRGTEFEQYFPKGILG